MPGSTKDPFPRRDLGLAADCQTFAQWVSGRTCLIVADQQCARPVEAIELDFKSASNSAGSEIPLIPMCEAHRSKLRAKGWDRFLGDAALTRDDLLDVAGFLRGRWNRRTDAEFNQFPIAL
jgi:hypothetical protein